MARKRANVETKAATGGVANHYNGIGQPIQMHAAPGAYYANAQMHASAPQYQQQHAVMAGQHHVAAGPPPVPAVAGTGLNPAVPEVEDIDGVPVEEDIDGVPVEEDIDGVPVEGKTSRPLGAF